MKQITMLSFLNTPEGTRMSIVYSEVNESGIVTKANQRENRVLIDEGRLRQYNDLKNYAQKLINE